MNAAAEQTGRDTISLVALVSLLVFVVISLVGYGTFGMNPSLLAQFPEFAGFYASSFSFFAQGQIWLAGLVLILFLVRRVGSAWLPAFAALYVISLGSELLGTVAGVPFGEYYYTSALGPKWFGHVPYLIPLSWFFMAVPSYALAARAVPDSGTGRVLFASLILLAWDLALDPAMSMATAYWVWSETGAYYGMPWTNLFGWYVTGLGLMAALLALRSDRWIERLPLGWLAAFYGANLLLPVGMSAVSGMWGAVLATVAILVLMGGLGWSRTRRKGVLPRGSEVTA